MQNSTFGGNPNASANGFATNGLLGPLNGSQDGGTQNGVPIGGRTNNSREYGSAEPSAARSPIDGSQQASRNSLQDGERTTRNLNDTSFSSQTLTQPSAQLPFRSAPSNFQDSQQQQSTNAQPSQQPLSGQPFSSNLVDSPSSYNQQPRENSQRRALPQMTEFERFSLPGLMALHANPSDGSTASMMAFGQDLSTLGMDLGSSAPLHTRIATPFAGLNDQHVVPDFTLPQAYTVGNVPPLHSRIGGFSDETLFAVFYQYCGDILQEIAAGELYSRDWRWHKDLRQWMMKDANFPTPIRVGDHSERGFYIFFDAMNWRRERREFVLNYDDLDQRHGTTTLGPSL
ncbi:transcriptional regulator [Cryomyces antarcticus]|nr:transcriptional regulator [Cryomyces antarcticus]